jgi:hypothetical protein
MDTVRALAHGKGENKMSENKAGRFSLGQVVATPGALEALGKNNQNGLEYVIRHSTGDWGEVVEEDKALNEVSLKRGQRLLSAYSLPDKTKIWIITEADRSVTTILLPEEY